MAEPKQTPPVNKPSKVDAPSNPVGRPLKFKTVDELEQAIRSYFDMCDPHIEERMVDGGVNQKGQTIWVKREVMTEQRPYGIVGLALALGVTRQTLLNYGEREEFFDTVDLARTRCEAFWETRLDSPYAAGAKFNLGNNYNGKYQLWSEKQILAGDPDAPLMPIGLDTAILNRRTNGPTPPSTKTDSEQ